MGSIVSLGIGNLEIDWGNNNHFINHSRLFNPSDQGVIDYHTYEGKTYEQKGFASPLSKVKIRLDLLGYSLKDVKRRRIWTPSINGKEVSLRLCFV